MSDSKHTDFICIVITACAILLTVLFLNGEALGITAITDGDSGSGQFTSNDLRADRADPDATRIVLTGDGAEITGNGAYANGGDVHIVYAGSYAVSGKLDDGSLIIDADGDDKLRIRLENADIRCEDGAALLIEQAEKVFLTLADGTENFLSSGSEYSQDAVSSGIDGAIYSRDDLTINGGGNLTVTSAYRHAVVCNDDLVITGGRISLDAPQDGIHANDSARIANADITISAGDDGVTVSNDENTGYFYMESGKLAIPSCYEGVEALNVTIAGGTVDIAPSDDGINAYGTGDSGFISVTGGDIRIVNPDGRDADGLDSNGNISISGGNLLISVSGNGGNCALDCGTESGGVCLISGGTVIAAGGNFMAEGFDSSSEQAFLMHNTETAVPEGTEVTLRNADGETLLSAALPCGFSSLILSSPDLRLGDSCTLQIGEEKSEITIDNSSAAFGSGFGFGMGRMRRGADGADGSATGGPGGRERMTDGTMSDEMPEGTPRWQGDVMPEAAPGGWGEEMPEAAPGGADEGMPEAVPENQSEMMPENAPKGQGDVMPEAAPGGQGDVAPEAAPGGWGEGMSERRPPGMRGGPPEMAPGGETRAEETPAPDPEQLILAGVSVLILIAGTVIVSLKKSLW